MSGDLTERLRSATLDYDPYGLCREAADEIERLQQALRDLTVVAEKRLRNYIDMPLAEAARAARAVLDEGNQQ